MPKSKKDLNVERFPKLADTLAKDKEFCSIVGRSSPDRAERLDAIIKNIAPTVEYTVLSSSHSISQNFAMHLARTPHNTLSPAAQRLQSMFLEYSQAKPRRRRSHKSVAKRIGFMGNDIHHRLRLPADIPIVELDPLHTPYPPEGHIVLERPYSSIPPPPKKRDPTCSYLYKYCQLDETMLQYTLDAHKEAIFVDKATQEPILVVLRDFAKDYYDIIQPWSVNLLNDSIDRRSHYVLRNDPGQMARIGVSPGQRSGSVFGWVRNLKKTKKATTGLEDHQYQVSSLFGFFYALVRGRMPRFAEDFEKAVLDSGIPRNDQTESKRFTLPFDQDITFQNHPLAPPEGYISRNFSRGIHCEMCWPGCPWGVYWNLARDAPNGDIGPHSGASFFNATYGIRVVNSRNTCVGWDRTLLHGTGRYEGGLAHVGLAILLSSNTKRTWEKYQAHVRDGTMQEDDLLWYPGSGDEEDSDDEE
jgi:hypothetical protein